MSDPVTRSLQRLILRGSGNSAMPSNCCGPIRRREFLEVGALGLGGLALGDILAARASVAPSGDVKHGWVTPGIAVYPCVSRVVAVDQ